MPQRHNVRPNRIPAPLIYRTIKYLRCADKLSTNRRDRSSNNAPVFRVKTRVHGGLALERARAATANCPLNVTRCRHGPTATYRFGMLSIREDMP